MTPQGHIRHQLDGRVRIAVPQYRGDRAYFDTLTEQLGKVHHIRAVRSNPLTGSLVLDYVGALDDILKRIDGADLLTVAKSDAVPTQAARKRNAVSALLGLEPMMLTGFFFGTVGVIQTLRGELMLPAMSAFWYALNAFRLTAHEAAGADKT